MMTMFAQTPPVVSYFSLFSYEFKVKPKNELGEGPLSESVSFNTESGTKPTSSLIFYPKCAPKCCQFNKLKLSLPSCLLLADPRVSENVSGEIK